MGSQIGSKEKMLSRIYLMQHTTRFNNLPVINRQNIAEHSNGVSLLCLLIGKEISEKLRENRFPLFLDYKEASLYANFHDYEETVSTDLPLPLKRKLGSAVMSAIDEIISEEIKDDYEAFGFNEESWDQAKSDRSTEWQLLKLCDYLELLLWTFNNKNQLSEGNYKEVLHTCKTLIMSYDIHKYSSTVLNILEKDEFTFTY